MSPFERIEDYLKGRLGPEELEAFERNLNEDVDLVLAVTNYKAGQVVLDELKKAQIKDEITNAINKQKIGHRRTKILGALIIALLTLVLVCRLSFCSEPQVDYFAMHFEPFPNIVDDGSRSGIQQQHKAFRFYDQQRYTEAVNLFNISSPEHINVEHWKFYQAINLMAVGKITEAIPILESIEGDMDKGFNQAIEWYLFLAYSKLRHKREAQLMKKRIKSNPGHYKRTRVL